MNAQEILLRMCCAMAAGIPMNVRDDGTLVVELGSATPPSQAAYCGATDDPDMAASLGLSPDNLALSFAAGKIFAVTMQSSLACHAKTFAIANKVMKKHPSKVVTLGLFGIANQARELSAKLLDAATGQAANLIYTPTHVQ